MHLRAEPRAALGITSKRERMAATRCASIAVFLAERSAPAEVNRGQGAQTLASLGMLSKRSGYRIFPGGRFDFGPPLAPLGTALRSARRTRMTGTRITDAPRSARDGLWRMTGTRITDALRLSADSSQMLGLGAHLRTDSDA